jgi:hypothetical protein
MQSSAERAVRYNAVRHRAVLCCTVPEGVEKRQAPPVPPTHILHPTCEGGVGMKQTTQENIFDEQNWCTFYVEQILSCDVFLTDFTVGEG